LRDPVGFLLTAALEFGSEDPPPRSSARIRPAVCSPLGLAPWRRTEVLRRWALPYDKHRPIGPHS
jgi:hypothetical protein